MKAFRTHAQKVRHRKARDAHLMRNPHIATCSAKASRRRERIAGERFLTAYNSAAEQEERHHPLCKACPGPKDAPMFPKRMAKARFHGHCSRLCQQKYEAEHGRRPREWIHTVIVSRVKKAIRRVTGKQLAIV